MKLYLSFILLILASSLSFAQRQDFTKAADVDPEAKAVLQKVKTKYDAYRTLEINFTLILEFPEEPVEEQTGRLIQSGDKYRLESQFQDIISDGKTAWLYLKNNKEVQINNVETDEESGFQTPRDFLRVYESKDHVYALTNQMVENGRQVQQIEFKPLDDDAEYSKMRLTIDKNNHSIKRIKVFSQDGSRYTIRVDKLTPNKSYPASTFSWAKAECPDCYVEDLRID